MLPGALTLEKLGGVIICFNLGRPKLQNLGGLIHIERPMFQNLGSIFCAKLYRNNGANIDEMYHKSMYDP